MKIINEKGKLFGIINIVDLVILVAVVVVVGAIVWQVFGDRVSDAVSQQEEVTLVVAIPDCPPDLVEEAMRQDLVGKQLVMSSSYVDAYITDVWTEAYSEDVTSADGSLVYATSPTAQTIYVEIVGQVAANSATPKIGSQELRAGRSFIVKTQTFESTGTIYYMQIGDEVQ